MQNEFEKQVQQKMAELDFIPTAPVWQKIEEQIRRKKDRRRLLLWLPLCCLLLGGAWLVLHGNGRSATTTGIAQGPAGNRSDNAVVKAPGNVSAGTSTSGKTARSSSLQAIPLVPAATTERSGAEGSMRTAQAHDPSPVKNAMPKERVVRTGSTPRSKWGKAKKDVVKEKIAVTKVKAIIEPGPDAHEPLPPADDSLAGHPEQKNMATDKADQKEVPVAKPSALRQDSTASLPVTEKAAPPVSVKRHHWKFGITAGGGVAVTSEALQKSSTGLAYANAVTAAPPPPPLLYNRHQGPSATIRGSAFSLGIVAQKQWRLRAGFSAGLAYHYYSTRMQVGQRMAPNVVQGGVTTGSGFYANDPGAAQLYHNKYHFIALPLAIDLQLLPHQPLKLRAGLTLQQMVSTTALQFNSQSQVYYLDQSAFHRMQVFSTLGLSYDLPLRRTTLSAGPQLQYGLSALEKNGTGHHLFAVGLQARLLLGKK